MNPKPKRWSFWLLAAMALLSIGAWQAAQIALDVRSRAASAVKASPGKTRSNSRKPSAKELAKADPVDTYIARAKRGMTDQEIRWMVEDFQASGLDPLPTASSKEAYEALHKRQRAWYAMTLDGVLGLTKEQQAEVLNNLRKIADRQIVAKQIVIGNPDRETLLEGAIVTSFPQWLSDEAAAPWNLCTLTDAQASLTVQKLVGKEAQDPFAPKSDARPTWGELVLSPPVVQDPLSGNPITVPAEGTSGSPSRNAALPGTGVFPLTPDQPTVALSLLGDRTLPGDLLQQARILQPSQLRMALLLRPGTAGELSRLLENPSPPLELPQGIRLSKPLQEELLRLLPRNQSTPQTPPDE